MENVNKGLKSQVAKLTKKIGNGETAVKVSSDNVTKIENEYKTWKKEKEDERV